MMPAIISGANDRSHKNNVFQPGVGQSSDFSPQVSHTILECNQSGNEYTTVEEVVLQSEIVNSFMSVGIEYKTYKYSLSDGNAEKITPNTGPSPGTTQHQQQQSGVWQ